MLSLLSSLCWLAYLWPSIVCVGVLNSKFNYLEELLSENYEDSVVDNMSTFAPEQEDNFLFNPTQENALGLPFGLGGEWSLVQDTASEAPIEKLVANVEIGCDGIAGSRMTIDKCGVCGGNGKSCQIVEGIFRTQNLENDFHLVVNIPVGATRINITETRPTRSYLALRSSDSNGRFYINGDLKLGRPDPSKTYLVAGAFFKYNRPYPTNRGESIYSGGPTNEALDFLLYFQGINPGIRFKYVLPNPKPFSGVLGDQRPRLESDGHDLLDHFGGSSLPIRTPIQRISASRSPSSHPLNMGSRYNHQPTRYDNKNNFRYSVPGSVYGKSNNPAHGNNRRLSVDGNDRFSHQTRSNDLTDSDANLHDLDEESLNTRRDTVQVIRNEPIMIGETAWRIRGLSPCSKSCAEGTRTTMVRCLKIETNEEIDNKYCSGPRPKIKTKKCNRQPCPPHYFVGKWSDCSRTCGNGRRTRTVVCRQHFAGNFTTTVSHRKCRRLVKPVTHEKCRVRECAHWEVDTEWTECNVRCGSGTQMRGAVCKAENGNTLPNGRCSSFRRPYNIRPCDAGPCVTKWYVTDWEECSADCGKGVQRRNIHCLNTAASAAGCSSRLRPNSTRTCARSSCGVEHEWFAGTWQQCSSKCGNGVQNRKVTCLSTTLDGTISVASLANGNSPCPAADKPVTQQPCNTQSCGSRWHYTPWSECSVSCGGGSRTRDLQCLDATGSYSTLCNIEDRPIEAERCNTISCIALREPGCEDTMRRCSHVLQARLCVYSYFRKVCCYTCSSVRVVDLRHTRSRLP